MGDLSEILDGATFLEGSAAFKRFLKDRAEQGLSDAELPKIITTKDAPTAQPVDAGTGAEGAVHATFVESDGSRDRDRDTLNVLGWVLEHFKLNPVNQFAHDFRIPPVGRSNDIWTAGGKLKTRTEFTPESLNPFGHMIGRMAVGGYMPGRSVGFMPRLFKINDTEMGIDHEEQELLEISSVNVGSNRGALMEAAKSGIDTLPMWDWVRQRLDGEGKLYVPRAHIEAMHAELKGHHERKPKGAKVAPKPAAKAAISYDSAHSDGTPKAARDAEWDGPGETAAASAEDLRVMSAIRMDDADPETKGAYKLPHHRASGEHALVWRGVTAAMGALLGARGGVDAPEADRRGAHAHLARHYREFDEEAPEFRAYVEAELKVMFPETTPSEFPTLVTATDMAERCTEALGAVAAMVASGAKLSEDSATKLAAICEEVGAALRPAPIYVIDTEPEPDEDPVFTVDPDELRASVRDALEERYHKEVTEKITGEPWPPLDRS